MELTDYRTLGRSGLRVSPLALGTMTFGTDWGWGADDGEARDILDAYLARGGNFIDTANFYTGGSAERLLGRMLAGRRDAVVLATKYSLSMDPANVNAGGNHRRSMVRAVEASLKRLDTDYIDLLYLHAWDDTTPGDEIMRAFDDLVRAGKILYAGISDTPAWQVARMQTVAQLRGWSPFVALQVEYSLVQRTGERELLPMALASGLGVVGWSPLAFGVLAGKYSSADLGSAAAATPNGSRREVALAHGLLTERTLAIAGVVTQVADEIGCSPVGLAIAWVLQRRQPAVMPIIGARTRAQFEENLAAMALTLPDHALARLDEISAIEPGFPHEFLALPMIRRNLFGEHRVEHTAMAG